MPWRARGRRVGLRILQVPARPSLNVPVPLSLQVRASEWLDSTGDVGFSHRTFQQQARHRCHGQPERFSSDHVPYNPSPSPPRLHEQVAGSQPARPGGGEAAPRIATGRRNWARAQPVAIRGAPPHAPPQVGGGYRGPTDQARGCGVSRSHRLGVGPPRLLVHVGHLRLLQRRPEVHVPSVPPRPIQRAVGAVAGPETCARRSRRGGGVRERNARRAQAGPFPGAVRGGPIDSTPHPRVGCTRRRSADPGMRGGCCWLRVGTGRMTARLCPLSPPPSPPRRA